MRGSIAILGAMLLSIGGASLASAKEVSHKLVGEITSVDATGKTLSVSAHPKAAHPEVVDFSVANDVKIMSGAKAGDLTQLAVGDPVTVTYVTHGAIELATRIERAQSATPKPEHPIKY